MTEYEVIDALSSLRAEAAQHVMNFVAVMFSYVIAAYVIGRKLTTTQVLLITLLYSIFIPGPILALYESVVAARDIHLMYSAEMAVATSATNWLSAAPAAVPFTMIFGWIVSLLFMYQVRRERIDGYA